MKFRNKATKEIRKAEMREDGVYLYSETAEEWRKCDWEVLAKYWEEYREEPKVGYMIDPMEEDCVATEDSGYEEPDIERAKELGIWFDTEEEAEKAVGKLKAFTRLKDKGFRFTLTPAVGTLDITPDKFQIEIIADMPAKWFCCDAVQKDLDICFGGEEE